MKRLLLLLTLAACMTGCSQSQWTGYGVGDSGPDAVTGDETAMNGVSNLVPNDAPVAYLGDVYESGTASDFTNNFQDAWLKHRDHGYPVPGDHDWPNHATGYDPWWGSRAPTSAGMHVYTVQEEGWTFIFLNSNEPIGSSSPQLYWANGILNNKSGNCTVVVNSEGRFGIAHPDQPNLQPLWNVMEGHAILYVSANDHLQAEYSPVQGITQLTSGAGGRSHYGLNTDPHPNLAWYQNTQYGVLKGAFTPGHVDWQFLNTAGQVLRSGSRTCTPRS